MNSIRRGADKQNFSDISMLAPVITVGFSAAAIGSQKTATSRNIASRVFSCI